MKPQIDLFDGLDDEPQAKLNRPFFAFDPLSLPTDSSCVCSPEMTEEEQPIVDKAVLRR